MIRSSETSDRWIKQLNLRSHVEGGFYFESYQSADQCQLDRYDRQDRRCSTAIYFLLRLPDQPRSVFHQIKADEMWHFYAGVPLTIHVLDEETSSHTEHVLFNNTSIHSEARPQVLVPHGKWFAAELFTNELTAKDEEQFTLCGCTCTPGFDFADFRIAKRSDLLKKFPHLGSLIIRLTREDDASD